jgi:hypothetical protein
MLLAMASAEPDRNGNKKAVNPLYPVVVLSGIAFTLTACAYGILMVRTQNPRTAGTVGDSPLLLFLDKHGFLLLMAELAVLTLASVAAMATDDYWTARRGSSDK